MIYKYLKWKVFLGSIVIFCLTACQSNLTNQESDRYIFEANYPSPYHFNHPDQKFILPQVLTEISGLSYSPESNSLITLNDEQGIIFYLNRNDGSIIDVINYGPPGDYEGICYHYGMIYTTKSNGDLSIIAESNGMIQKVYKGILSREQNIEGLCYSPTLDLFLLAAKGNSTKKKKHKNLKAIFKMDYRSGNIDDEPFMLIDLLSSANNLNPSKVSLGKNKQKRLKQFAPSGIAEHPISHDYYILSAKGALLCIINQEKRVKAIIFLDATHHRQAEGLCFDQEANLYIANEANEGQHPVLYKYKMI